MGLVTTILNDVLTSCYIVHNDFHQTHGIFDLFTGLQVEDMDKSLFVDVVTTNGATNGTTNGYHHDDHPRTNGTSGKVDKVVSEPTLR